MARNIYDDPDFFAGYSRLRRSVEGLDGAPEWPALRALLPDLAGRRVLDLGCGFGWFCRWARAAGAAQIIGVDVSTRMLERARALTDDPAIRYVEGDLERLDLEPLDLAPGTIDLAYSSLALHYIEDLAGLLATTRRALRPGGRLVFSAEHPIFTAPSRPGWVTDDRGGRHWPVDRYLDEGPRTTDWLAPGVVKQHRTIATYLTLLLAAGFTLSHLDEWGPSPAQIAALPPLADERQRPPFLLVAATR
jgi:SAM-dependent methyltransferase